VSNTNVLDLLSLNGRTALITGASGFLGSAMAEALAEAGASVIVSSRTMDQARRIAEKLPRTNQKHHAIALDQMDERSIENGFKDALASAGRIDILVNNGHEPTASDWRSVTADQFTRQLANLTGYFLLSRHFHDHVVAQRTNGSVILLGSMYGVVGSYPDAYQDICAASPVAYHALKGGIVQLTRHLAIYWAKDQVRVNCLSPGPFPSAAAPAEMVRRLQTKSPMGRMGKPEELKGALVFLASNASSYMTGQNLIIDGGWTAW
jgi:NAD(P)-dependent dehydrogenase (short-subunit alcohol dehydrogenase family)